MSPRALTDAERIVSIREVIEAARGDWHEATALLSVGSDLHWLLTEAETVRRRLAALDTPRHTITVVDDRCAICWREVYETGDYRGGRYRHELDEAAG